MTDKLIPFVFQSTGVEVALKPVSALLIVDARRSVPRPLPPSERVQNGDGSWREEPNYDAPAYARALEAYNEKVELAVRKLCVKRGVVLRLTDAQKEEVTELREFWRAEYGQELDPDDRYVYVAYIAAGSQADYEALAAALTNTPGDPKSPRG